MGDKKNSERKCLEQALKYGLTEENEETKRILRLCELSDIVNAECPDFIGVNKDKSLMLGIEHFRIDEFVTEKSDGRMASTGVMYKKEIETLYSKWKKPILSLEEIPIKAVEDIMQVVQNQLERKYFGNYNGFISSFAYVLNKHMKHLDDYWNKLRIERQNLVGNDECAIKMVFFLEIYTDFQEMYLNQYNSFKKNDSGLMPFFESVITLLEEVPKNKVQYFIFYLKDYSGEKSKVIAFDNSDLKRSIRKQKIKVYKYVGSDYGLKTFGKLYEKIGIDAVYEKANDRIDMNFEINHKFLEPPKFQQLVFGSMKLAWETKNEGRAFACDVLIQSLLYIYGDHVIGWKSVIGENGVCKPIIRPMEKKMIEKRSHEFDEKIKVKIEG